MECRRRRTSVIGESEQAIKGNSFSDFPWARRAYCVVTKFLPFGPSIA